MNTDLQRFGCVIDYGWFFLTAYAVDLITIIALLYLLIRNTTALRSINTGLEDQIVFRLLISKRVTQLLGLFCAFQFFEFVAYSLFILALPDSRSPALPHLMSYSYRPVVFTFGVLTFGLVQYAVLDAVLKFRMMKKQPKGEQGNAAH